MFGIQQHPGPSASLLRRYAAAGAFTDCYATDVPRRVDHADLVEAFYTTWVFRLERLILAWVLSRPSTDAEARELARGTRERFSAWVVEARTADQVLLADVQGRTRSWLMVEPMSHGGTRLYFGSAIVPERDGAGRERIGWGFRALGRFHHLYSQVLLASARRRLLARYARQAG